MALNPIASAPKNEQFIILQDESAVVYEVARWSVEKGNWVREEGEPIQITPTHWMPLPGASLAPSSDNLSGRVEGALRQIPRVGLYAGICVTAGLMILFVLSFVGNFAGPTEKDRTAVGETSSGATNSSRPASSRVADRNSDKADVPSRDVAPARAEIETLKMRTAAQTAAPAESSQAAQVSAAEQKQAVEQERQRGEALVRELVSAREEVEAFKAAANAAGDAVQKNQASVSEQKDALERERRRGDALARQLASAREEVEAVTARVAATNAAHAGTAQILQVAQASAAEQSQALERERQRGDALVRELASAREAVEAREATERAAGDAVQKAQTSAGEQKKALEKERQRGDALARDLVPVREEVEALKARVAAATAGQIEAAHSLQAAREEVEAVTARVAATNAAHAGTAQILQVAQASGAEQSQALERERQRGDALVRELASAREEAEGLTARVAAMSAARSETAQTLQAAQASAAEQKQALERERQRGDALARDLASAREEVEARKAAERAAGDAVQKAQASASEQKDALERERQRGDALARDLVSLREEGEALKARVAATNAAHMEAAQSLQAARALTSEQKNALEQERQRGDALARDLASLQEEGEALKARVAAAIVASIEPTQSVETARALPKASSPQAAAPSQPKVAFVLPAADDGRGLAAQPQTVAETKSSADSRENVATPARWPQVASVGERSITTAPPLRPIEELNALWLQRGENFVAVGDFASARMVFQRAAEAGDAQAALLLGGTYDPNVIDRFRAKGLAADIAKARWWYEKARALGSPEAPRRLDLLAQPRR